MMVWAWIALQNRTSAIGETVLEVSPLQPVALDVTVQATELDTTVGPTVLEVSDTARRLVIPDHDVDLEVDC